MKTLGIIMGSVAIAIASYTLVKMEKAKKSDLPMDELIIAINTALADTCAFRVCKEDITIRTIEATVTPSNLREILVEAEENEQVIAGGFRTEDDRNVNLWRNAPSESGNGWVVGISNFGRVDRTVTAYAICLKVQ